MISILGHIIIMCSNEFDQFSDRKMMGCDLEQTTLWFEALYVTKLNFWVWQSQGLYSPTMCKHVLFLVLQILLYLAPFECNTSSDWLYGLANQKLCYIQIYEILEKKTKNILFLGMVGEPRVCIRKPFLRTFFVFLLIYDFVNLKVTQL